MADTWVKTDTGAYVRLGAYRTMRVEQDGSVWRLSLALDEGTSTVSLNGTFSSEDEAQKTAGRILKAIDPATFGRDWGANDPRVH